MTEQLSGNFDYAKAAHWLLHDRNFQRFDTDGIGIIYKAEMNKATNPNPHLRHQPRAESHPHFTL